MSAATEAAPQRTIDTSALPGPAQRMLAENAPAPLRMMAAKGIAPGLKPDAIVTLVCVFAGNANAELAATARHTLESFPEPILQGAFATDLQPRVLELLAEAHHADSMVVSRLLASRHISSEALELVAERANEAIGEIVAASDSVLLRFPRVIEKLYMNKRVRMSTADRLVDLAVRNKLELDIPAFKQAAAAIQNQLIPEATEEPNFDDELFQKIDELSAEIATSEEEDTHDVDDEGEEHLKEKFAPLTTQLANMTVSQKIRRATLGTAAERLLLVRERNRLVATAAATSPLLKENEAVLISASRSVIEDVLRVIAQNKDFMRQYKVKMNLVCNPKTPFTFASRIIPHLRDNDLKSLSKSKNVPAAIQTAVRQQLQRKKKD
jgi:hypothetical protein